FFQAEDGIRDFHVTGVQTCALPILLVVGSLVLSLRRRTKAVAHPDDAKLRMLGAVVGVLLIGQVLLGIATVKLALPLGLAVAHKIGRASCRGRSEDTWGGTSVRKEE